MGVVKRRGTWKLWHLSAAVLVAALASSLLRAASGQAPRQVVFVLIVFAVAGISALVALGLARAWARLGRRASSRLRDRGERRGGSAAIGTRMVASVSLVLVYLMSGGIGVIGFLTLFFAGAWLVLWSAGL